MDGFQKRGQRTLQNCFFRRRMDAAACSPNIGTMVIGYLGASTRIQTRCANPRSFQQVRRCTLVQTRSRKHVAIKLGMLNVIFSMKELLDVYCSGRVKEAQTKTCWCHQYARCQGMKLSSSLVHHQKAGTRNSSDKWWQRLDLARAGIHVRACFPKSVARMDPKPFRLENFARIPR